MKNFIFFISLFIFSPLNSQNFEHVYENVIKIKPKTYSNVKDLYNQIVLSGYDNEEKVHAIARYITENIKYGNRAKSPLNTINSGEGVCQDYSELFIALCDIAGIENIYVTGDGRTSVSDIGFFNSNHSWNLVKINDNYQIFDLTWAAGAVNNDNKFIKDFNPYYFNTPPELFIRNHFPDDEKWQLLSNPVTKNEYINQPTYDQSIFNLSLKRGVVKDNNFNITFNSKNEFHSATIYKWNLNEYGSTNGVSIPLEKEGNNYKIFISEDITGAYRYDLSLWSYSEKTESGSTSISSSIKFKLITPDFKVSKPKRYDKLDPWGLIESYLYVFHSSDNNFFKELNPSSKITNLNQIKYFNSLNKSLSDWFGDYKRYYVSMGKGDIYYPYDNFRVILSKGEQGYVFKEIRRETLKIGKSGYGVQELQKKLGVKPTGFFDKNLENVVKSFQKSKNLSVDGIVGQMTFKILGM